MNNLPDNAEMLSKNTLVKEAILFDFAQDELRTTNLRSIVDDLPSVGFNTQPVFAYKGMIGWAFVRDPSHHHIQIEKQNAPLDPDHGSWNASYPKLDNEFGIEAWYEFEEWDVTIDHQHFGEVDGLYREWHELNPP